MSGLGTPAEAVGDQDGSRPEVWIGERRLACAVCGEGSFAHRPVLLNTPGMTSMGLDWANRSAVGAVCRACGFVHEFLSDKVTWRAPAGE